MAWFKRKTKGIHTSTKEKKDTPEGLWHKTPTGKIIETKELENNSFVSPEDGFHIRIGSQEYFNILFDDKFKEIDQNIKSKDPLKFTDKKSYNERVKDARKKTGLKDAIKVAVGKSYGENVVIACMDFKFIGGSMGSVVGEKISRAIDTAIKKNLPLIIISKSGGARMMEASFSLMQLAKTSAKLAQLSNEGVPYFSILTDPTTGGITASFAMLGDLNIGEPNALIGFAGPRVVKETIGKDLPKGFQTAEFVQEHGFLDMIVDRKNMKEKIAQLIRMYKS